MGWSSESYRYSQYKNALKDIEEQKKKDENLDLKKSIKPRVEYNLETTLIESLKETIKTYENLTILEPENENDDRWFICSNCGMRLSPLYWEGVPDGYEWSYCPYCGKQFVSKHMLKERGLIVEED